jgi:Fe2+ transport system protein B
MRKTTKNAVLPLGMNLAKQGNMRNGLSIKHLTLAAGIVVALIVAFMLVSAGKNFSAKAPVMTMPSLDIPSFAKVAIQKISTLY